MLLDCTERTIELAASRQPRTQPSPRCELENQRPTVLFVVSVEKIDSSACRFSRGVWTVGSSDPTHRMSSKETRKIREKKNIHIYIHWRRVVRESIFQERSSNVPFWQASSNVTVYSRLRSYVRHWAVSHALCGSSAQRLNSYNAACSTITRRYTVFFFFFFFFFFSFLLDYCEYLQVLL